MGGCWCMVPPMLQQSVSNQPVAPTWNHGLRLAHTDAGHALHRDLHLLISLARRLTRLLPLHLDRLGQCDPQRRSSSSRVRSLPSRVWSR